MSIGTPTSLPASPHRQTTLRRSRNINLVPIDYAFQPRLRGRLTLRRLSLRMESLGFRRTSFLTCLIVTQAGIITSIHSTTPYGMASMRIERSPTNVSFDTVHSFGSKL